MSVRDRRAALISVAFSLVLSVVLVEPSVGGECRPANGALFPRRESVSEGWYRIFPAAPVGHDSRFNAMGISPKHPNVIYVAFPSGVMQSDDWGCTWRQLLDTAALPTGVDSLPDTVSSMAIATNQRGQDRVIVVVNDSLVSGAHGSVFANDGGSRKWEEVRGPNGLPFAWPTGVKEAPSKPTTLYISASPMAATPPLLYRSDDAGRTWTAGGAGVGNFQSPLDPVEVSGFAIDSLKPHTVWSWIRGSLWRSTDGAESWETIQEPYEDAFLELRGVASRGDLAIGALPAALLTSTDGATTWKAIPMPDDAPVQAVHFATSSASPLLSLGGAFYRGGSAGIWVGSLGKGDWSNLNPVEPARQILTTQTRGAPLLTWGLDGRYLGQYFGDW